MMSGSGETWNQWLLGHRPLSRFFQMDRLVQVFIGRGTQTIPSFHLPHGRYTVFVTVDRKDAIRSFELLGNNGFRLYDRWPWNDLGAPLVQTKLPHDNYRMVLDARSELASWRIDLVLNSMRSWARPPKPWRRQMPVPKRITLSNDSSPTFFITQTGSYAMAFRIAGFDPQDHRHPEEFCPFRLEFRAADGYKVLLGEGGKKRAQWPTGAFLGAGEWSVDMATSCEWQLVISPRVGPGGGGAHWF